MANRYFDNSELAEAIRIANGQTKGVSHINKFGYLVGTASNALETVWDGGGIYSYIDSVGASSTLTVTSNATDSGLSIEVQGLDASYQSLTETITATSAGNSGTSEFYRVFRALVVSDVDSTNSGDIAIDAGPTTLAQISANAGQTLMAVYTVPAGKTAYLKKFQGSVGKDGGDAAFSFMARPEGGSFNIKGRYGTATAPVTYDYPVPLEFEEKTDLEIRSKGANNIDVGAIFDLILLDN